MQTAYLKQHAQHIKDILAALPKSGGDDLKEFTSQFYARIMNPELERVDATLAASIAASAYEFIQKRESGEPRIRVFQPQKRKHGYELSSVVVELLNDDMPFLVDSLTAELTRHGFTIRETYHPIFRVKRDARGQLQELGGLQEKAASFTPESLIHFEISVLPEGMAEEQLEQDLLWVVQHIRAAVTDWRQIVEKAKQSITDIGKAPAGNDKEMISEIQDFMNWLINRNFVFLGYAEYEISASGNGESLNVSDDARLGVLKITDDLLTADGGTLPPEANHFLHSSHLIEVNKSSRRSAVHRPVPMDTIAIKKFNSKRAMSVSIS